MPKAASYIGLSYDNSMIASKDLTGLNFTLTDIADAIDHICSEKSYRQHQKRFVATITNYADEHPTHFAVFNNDIGHGRRGLRKNFCMDIGTTLEVFDCFDNLTFSAEYNGYTLVATDTIFIAPEDLSAFSKYLRRIAKKF